jgi:vacuolar-type H+-ATPase subunit I/STV1
LPEKPDAPSFRRTETVKPDGASSPARSDVKISSLADALASAKQEIEAQSVRVRDLEALLTEERRARVDAEERANQLERESAKDQGQLSDGPADEENVPEPSPGLDQDGSADLHNDSTPPTIVDAAAARLQQRLDSMMSEMNEMKQHMEIYRRRAEDAEADSAMARKTLAEMVEKIRQDDATKASKSSKRRSRSDSDVAQASSEPPMMPPTDKETEEGEIPIMSEKDLQLDGPKSLLKHIGVQTGHLVSKEASHDSIKASRALATRHSGHQNLAVTHGAPAVSILTVVALGVAVMAWLNSYPKVER